MEKQELIRNMQDIIQGYDRILFLRCDLPKINGLFSRYFDKQIKKSVLLLSKEKVGICLNGMDCTLLDTESGDAIRKLYHTYEFSNKFIMLSAGSNFGTILNYVNTGLLSLEAAASALLD